MLAKSALPIFSMASVVMGTETMCDAAGTFGTSSLSTMRIALFGIEIACVFVRGRLCHGEHDVGVLDVRMIDHVVADDDLGAGCAAARLGTVGLRLRDIHAAGSRRLGEDNGGSDDALAAGA